MGRGIAVVCLRSWCDVVPKVDDCRPAIVSSHKFCKQLDVIATEHL